MLNSRTVVYNPNIDPYKPKVEIFSPNGNSIFQDVYVQALEQIDLILESGKNKEQSVREEYDYRNIIAFTGERGAGKTSAMMSIAETLKHRETLPDSFREKNEKFLTLSPINPAHISDNETVIDIVLAKLYHEFESQMKSASISFESSLEEKRLLYQSFERIHDLIQKQCQGRSAVYQEAILFQNTAAGTKIKNYMYELVHQYLKIMRFDNLVLQIDDIDLNLEHAYTICEDLRKYLSIPNVVILFAINLEQLYSLLEQHYYGSMNTLYSHGGQAYVEERVPRMAEQYLKKLIPSSRRCVLPELKMTTRKHIRLRIEGESNHNEAEKSMVTVLLEKIHAKCGLILVAEDSDHPLLPDTLRGMHHLLTVLNDMDDVKIINEDHTICYHSPDSPLARQLERLEQYFQDEVAHNLPRAERKLLDTFNEIPNKLLNKFIIKHVYFLLKKANDSGIPVTDKFGDIEMLSNIPEPENISVGDVIVTLRAYERTFPDHTLFPALVRLFYSIRSIRTRFLDQEHGSTELFYLLGGSIVSLPCDKIINDSDLVAINNYIKNLDPSEEKLSKLRDSKGEQDPIVKMAATIHDDLTNGRYPDSLFLIRTIDEIYESDELNKIASLKKYMASLDEPYYEARLDSENRVLKGNTYKYYSVALPSVLVYRLLSHPNEADIIPLYSMDMLQYFSSHIDRYLEKKNKYVKKKHDKADAFEMAIKNIVSDCIAYSTIDSELFEPKFDDAWEQEKTFVRQLHEIQGKLDSQADEHSWELCRNNIEKIKDEYKEKLKKITELTDKIPSMDKFMYVEGSKKLIQELPKMPRISFQKSVKPADKEKIKGEFNALQTTVKDKCKNVESLYTPEDYQAFLEDMKTIFDEALLKLQKLEQEFTNDDQS